MAERWRASSDNAPIAISYTPCISLFLLSLYISSYPQLVHKDYSFSMYAKSSEKLAFLTP